MNRNTDDHFGGIPSKNIRRSKFKRDCKYQTTFNTGEIVPIYVDEVLPGDTAKIRVSSLIRMLTPINPTMDNLWADIYFFFVPRRLTWEHWQEFMGENTADEWTEKRSWTIPQLTAPSGGWTKGSLGEKIYGVQGVGNISVDAQYMRSYVCIFNEWFRNQNVTEMASMSTGDATTAGSNGTNYVTDLEKGGAMAKAVKYADYFTRALPSPQKGPDIYLPVSGMVPVITDRVHNVMTPYKGMIFEYMSTSSDGHPSVSSGTVQDLSLKLDTNISSGITQTPQSHTQIHNTAWSTDGSSSAQKEAAPVNLWANLNAGGTIASINELRQAFAIQRMYELDARGGTRYIEILKAHFGVDSPDARLQRPEYLGGKRIPINMTQVVQSSSTDSTSPQGNTAGMSLTIDSHDCFTKSFVEHGILMGLCVVRQEHTYQQGLARIFNRKNRVDFYFPELANLSEQYIKNKEIYAQGSSAINPQTGNKYDEEAFGYQEAWAEYRYGINRITGELNSNYATPLDSWHYGDDYNQLPVLSDAWIRETDVNVARTLAIQGQDQFKADFYFDQTWTRPMPIYSIPSLSGWN